MKSMGLGCEVEVPSLNQEISTPKPYLVEISYRWKALGSHLYVRWVRAFELMIIRLFVYFLIRLRGRAREIVLKRGS